MDDPLGSHRVASLYLWYFSIVSGNSMFFLGITCYIPWTFWREHCPLRRNNTTGTPRAHRVACGHGRGVLAHLALLCVFASCSCCVGKREKVVGKNKELHLSVCLNCLTNRTAAWE